ncbi:FAST kinase domain-containing protein 5, mitochondrial-like isoform X2 [Liolophura sinensis]|uniref:FAST kinase domain-containing protein 5, mitochondrial-like isoform X2 n=1 Tax=Liolophura sinensis TaxID=3198878 RepID=UPI0031595CFE
MTLLMKSCGLKCRASSVCRSFIRFTQPSTQKPWCRGIHELRTKEKMCMNTWRDQLSLTRAFATRPANEENILRDERKAVWRDTSIRRPHSDLYFPEEENEHFHLVLERMPEYKDKLITVIKECDRRYDRNNWNLQQLFLAADFHFATRCSAFLRSGSVAHLHDRIQTQLKHLSKTELVLFMYHCGVSRQITKSAVPQILEKVLDQFEMLNFEELAIICIGLFKTNNIIYMPQFLTKLSQRVHRDMATASHLALSAVFKTLCKSANKNTSRYNSDFQEVLVSLLDKSTTVLPDLPFSTFIHIFRFFLGVHWMSEAFLATLVETVLKDEVSKWRVKEISRFLFHLCNFTCFSGDPKFQRVIEVLLGEFRDQRRRKEFQMFPESLLQGLVGLSFVDVYDEELTDFLFGNDFQDRLSAQRKSLQKVDFIRDLFQLDRSLKIDRPDYHGNHLATTVKNMSDIPMNPTRQVSRVNSIRDVILKEVMCELVSLLGGQDYLRVGHLLPHYHTTDIEVRLGEDGKPIPVREWTTSSTTAQTSQQQQPGNLHKLLVDLSVLQKQQRLALVMFGPNCYHVYRDKGGHSSKQLLGLHQMKLRHLACSGFTNIQIPYFEFNQASDRSSYLKHKLFGQDSR